MKELASFVVGFAAGWGVRSVFDSGRDAMVAIGALGYRAVDAARRHTAYEREHFEDLVAEAKAKWEVERQARAEACKPASSATESASPGPRA